LTSAEKLREAQGLGRHLRPRILNPCVHEHACVRCSLLRPDPAQRARIEEIRDNLIARINEAEREGWLGEVTALEESLRHIAAKKRQAERLHTRIGQGPDSLA
jgi:hypothetical protein